MLYKSQYNIEIPCNDKIYIYNTISGAVIKVKDNSCLENPSNSAFLFKQGFLVEDKENELNVYKFKYYKRMFDDRIINITIVPTMNCNLSCYYCFEGQKNNFFMNDSTIEALMKYLSNFPEKKINITWFGGEPLLAFPIINNICKKLEDSNIEYRSTIITNGTLFNKEIICRLSHLNIEYIQITFDGNREEHNSKRFFKNSKGTFDLILDNLKTLILETNIKINIQVNIDRINFSSYEKIYSLLYELFPNEIGNRRLQVGFNRIQDRTDFDYKKTCFSENDYFNVIKYFAQINNNAKNSLKIPSINLPCMLRCVNTLVLAPNGDIYKCLEHIDKTEKKVGNINDLSVSTKLLAQYALKFSPFDDNECRNCKILPICGGGCPIDREKKEKCEIKTVCPYQKENIDQIIKLIYDENIT